MDLRYFFFIFLVFHIKESLTSKENEPQGKKPNLYSYSDSYTLFAARFWRVAMKHLPKEENLFFYPMSLLRVLTWLQLGTNKNSEMQIQGATMLVYDKWKTHLNLYTDSLSDSVYHQMFSLGDGGFFDPVLRKYLKQGYRKELIKAFKLDVTKLPAYENPTLTSHYLNEHLTKVTHKKISKFFSRDMFGKKGNAMLYSGLHFKGNWESAFNRQNTKQREFYISDKKNVSTPMMNLKLDLSVSKNYKQKGFNLIELPLENSRFKLLIVEPTGFSLERIVERLTGMELIAMLGSQGEYFNVDLTLPRFRLKENKHDITHYLIDNEVGIRDIFNEIKADFSNMTFKRDVLAREISQASYFDMTETAVEMAGVVNGHLIGNDNKKRRVPPDYERDEGDELPRLEMPKLRININQPFMLILMDTKFRIPLVIGKISNPKPDS